jgi:hypothetical protein
MRTENQALVARAGTSVPPSTPSVAADMNDAGDLPQLRARLALLKARPPGVTDAGMKSASEWQNRGRATPAEAYETYLWAYTAKDADTLAAMYDLSAADRTRLNAFFATLPPSVQAKYRTPERLIAEVDLKIERPTAQLPVAFQVVEEQANFKSGTQERVVKTWLRLASGAEQMNGAKFAYRSGSWSIEPAKPISDSAWTNLLATIDPATGQINHVAAERSRTTQAEEKSK